MARTITFQASQKMGLFIENQVKSGDYSNLSEGIRAANRLMEGQTAISSLEQLRQLIQEGDDSPDVENFSMENIINGKGNK